MMAKNAKLNAAKQLPGNAKDEILPTEAAVVPAAASSGSDGTAVNEAPAARQSTCAAKYSKRQFFSKAESRSPSLLYTFPGSGNTWCRLLIEYGLGIYTGSVYNDQALMESLPGEFTCNNRVAVIKAHPHTHHFPSLRDGGFYSDGGHKCAKGNVLTFSRAILLIRSPFDSIWSEFKRRESKSHVGAVDRSNFNWPRWQANAAALSNSYHDMWRDDYLAIEKSYRKEDILYIRYEDLRNNSTRLKVMSEMAVFLNVSASDDKLLCSFELASQITTHRAGDGPRTMSIEEAYTQILACKMWALFGPYATRHGYSVVNNYDCSGYSKKDAIQNVLVGTLGQYDLSYVMPGEKLLDFGGHSIVEAEVKKAPPVKAQTPKNKKQGGGKAGGKKKNLNGGVEGTADMKGKGGEAQIQKKQNRKEQRERVALAKARKRAAPALGMTMEQADAVPGVGGLGIGKPAWQ